MNPTEKCHANPPKPTATPSAPAPAAGGSGTQWLFSTRLKVEKEAPQTPGSVSAWIKTKVLTPTRDTLRRVDVRPVMNTIFGVRRQLAIDSPSEQDLPLPQGSYPSKTSNNQPNHPGGVSKFIVAPEMPAAGASQFSVSPGTNDNNNSTQSPADAAAPTPVNHPGLLGENQLPSRSEGVQDRYKALDIKIDTIAATVATQFEDVNQAMAEFSVKSDRLLFDFDQNQANQQLDIRGLLEQVEQAIKKVQAQATEEISKVRVEQQKALDGMFVMMSDIAQSVQAAPPVDAMDGLVDDPPRESDCPKATEALLQARKNLLSGSETTECEILAQFQLSRIDPQTFTAYKRKYNDIPAFTEVVCKEDPTIETELAAAIHKQGPERAAALQALGRRMGPHSHRQNILGDAMLFHLITRPSSNAQVRKSAASAARDFITQGHTEPSKYIERCLHGHSLLMSGSEVSSRDADVKKGMTAVRHHQYLETLVMGITLKLGYSTKPACDLQGKLDSFRALKQYDKESTHNFINRFDGVVAELVDVTTLVNKPEYLPNGGEILTQLKKASKQDVRSRANHVLQYMWHIPLRDITYQELTAALLKAEELSAEEADDIKSIKPTAAAANPTSKPPATPTADGNNTPHQDAGEKKTPQDPVLTQNLKGMKICVNYVAEQLGASGRPCQKSSTPEGCPYHHNPPAVLGLKDEDYAGFKVLPAHLGLPGIKEPDLKYKNPCGPQIPPTVACPAVAGDEKPAQETVQPGTQTCPAPSINAPAIVGCHLLKPMPSFMRGAVQN